MASLLASRFHGSLLSSSFHGVSLLASRFEGGRLHGSNLGLRISCSSMQSRSGSPQRARISRRHVGSSYLASSLQMQTPQGEAFLAMANQRLPPVVISQAASQQLELLAAAAEATSSSRDDVTRSDGQEGVLKRRIAEMKEKEIIKALQDIVLALVTHMLMHATMVPPQDATVALQDKPLDDHRLRAVHHPDVQPLIDRHVAIAIFGKNHAELPFEPNKLTRVDTLEMGKVYAASVMYGYFLARVHQRFQLERMLQLESVSMQRDGLGGFQSEVVPMEPYIQINGSTRLGLHSMPISMEAYLQAELGDKEAFHRMSSIRCFHTLEVIERHCQALFGEARLHMHRNPCHINTFTTSSSSSSILTIHLGSMRTLILQALAFGALLWDVENNFVSRLLPFN